MIWDKLVDRCLLFTDAPSGLLRELLKEAEDELANKLELYDAIYTITVPDTISGLGLWSADANSDNSYTKLPPDYLRDIQVTHRGVPLRKMEEFESFRKPNGELPGGNPTAYAIAGDYVVFNAEPVKGEVFLLHYKSTLNDFMVDKVFNILHYDKIAGSSNDAIWLDTTLGDKLNGYTIRWETNAFTIGSGTTTSMATAAPGLPDKYVGNKMLKVAFSLDYGSTSAASRYVLNYDFGTLSGTTSASDPYGQGIDGTASIGSLVRITNYRTIAPVIPDKFHKDLCNYAVAIANAKGSPDMYDKYWNKWESNIGRLINEAQDRDLIFTIREEL